MYIISCEISKTAKTNKMNILMIIVFLIMMWTINGEVEVIPVNMPLLASAHAKELTRIINLHH